MSTKAQLDAAIKAAEQKYGDLPPGVLSKIAKVESNYGQNLVNPTSSARGPFQFMEKTGPEFGLATEADRMDFDKSTDAAARLVLRNKAQLEKSLGRAVTPGELYLAHQQGAGGALKLLRNPNAKAVDVVGAKQVKLNGGRDNMTAGEFANLWVGKVDGGAATAPGKKLEAPAGGVTPAKDFYTYHPGKLGVLAENTALMQRNQKRLEERAAERAAPAATSPIGLLGGDSRAPASAPSVLAAEPFEGFTPQPQAAPKSRTQTAILQGLATFDKQRTLAPIINQPEYESTPTGPSGLGGTISRGITSAQHGMESDASYFNALVDTITGNERGKRSNLFNAQMAEGDTQLQMAGIQEFGEFLKEPTFDGFITQAAFATGQVGPSAIEAIAFALVTGGGSVLATGTKAALGGAGKTVAMSLVKDIVRKKVIGAAVDKAEDTLLEGMYRSFKRGALAGAFGSEYRMMAGGAFSEFEEGGEELGVNQALMSLGIALPQAAIGVGGEAAILKMLGETALKKATITGSKSVLRRFADKAFDLSVKSGLMEGGTEVAQDAISVAQRFAIDPEYTMEEAQLRLVQSAFAGFFGGAGMGGAAGVPAAGLHVMRNAGEMLKKASEARIEAKVNAETKNITDAGLAGATTPEPLKDVAAQYDAMMRGAGDKRAMFVSETQLVDYPSLDIEPGGIKRLTDKRDGPHKGKEVYAGRLAGRGLIVSPDPLIVEEVLAEAESGGDVDAVMAKVLGYAEGPKEGDTVIRVKDAEGNTMNEQMVSDDPAIIAAAQDKAFKIADDTPGAVVDVTDPGTVLEERAQAVAAEKAAITPAPEPLDVQQTKDEGAFLRDLANSITDEEAASLEAAANQEIVRAAANPAQSKNDGELFPDAPEPETRGKPSVEKHSQSTKPFLGDAVRPAPYHDLSDPDNSLTERKHRDEMQKRVAEGRFDVQQVPLKGLVPTQDVISDQFRGVPEKGGMHGKLPLVVKFKGVSYIEDGHHRLAAAAERGDKTVEARVVDLDSTPKKAPSESAIVQSRYADVFNEDTGRFASEMDDAELRQSINDYYDALTAETDPDARDDIETTLQGFLRVQSSRSKGKRTKDMALSRSTGGRVNTRSSDTSETDAGAVVDDNNEVVDQDNSTDAEVDAELNAMYQAIDMEHSELVSTYKPDKKQRTPEEQAAFDADFTLLIYGLPESQNDVAANYRDFKDIMPKSMLNELLLLTQRNPESVYDIQQNDEYELQIMQRDASTDPDILATRAAVRDAIRQVRNMSKLPSQNGVTFRNPDGTTHRGTHEVRKKNKSGKYETTQEEGQVSSFYLSHIKPDYAPTSSVSEQASVAPGDRELLTLSGTPGRHGLFALAQLGAKLNAQIGRGADGASYTALQKYRLGLDTILGALQIAGYQLVYTPSPTSAPIPVEEFRALKGQARNEVILDLARQNKRDKAPKEPIPVTLGEIYGEPLPLDLSDSDFDATTLREELDNAKEKTAEVITSREELGREQSRVNGPDGPVTVTRVEQGPGRRIEGGVRRDTAVDPAQTFAQQEDRKKGTSREELADAREIHERNTQPLRALLEHVDNVGNIAPLEELIDSIPSDVIITAKKISGGNKPRYKATLTSDRFSPKTIEHFDLEWVIARAAAESLLQPDTSPNRYDRFTLETADSTVQQREQHPEILGVPAPKNQTSIKEEGATSSGTNSVDFHGRFGKLASRVTATAMSLFNFHKPISIMSLRHLEENFASLTDKGTKYEGGRDYLQSALNDMRDPDKQVLARVLKGRTHNLIILRDEVNTPQYDAKGDEVYVVGDAAIGALIAHELGHIVLDQEWSSQIDGTPLRKSLWKAYIEHARKMKSEGNVVESYTNDRDGFEEWYSDQLMAFVYKKSQAATNGVDSYFKRIAKALNDFFQRVNKYLEDRLRISRSKVDSITTFDKEGKPVKGGTVSDYFDQVSARHSLERTEAVAQALKRAKEDRKANNEPTVIDEYVVKSLTLNIMGRLPAGAAARVQSLSNSLLSSSSMVKGVNFLKKVMYASVDFMGAPMHGAGGANLKTFFGSLSQSLDTLGWNKRALLAQNTWHNKLSAIFGITDKSDPKIWTSPAVEFALKEAMDESIDTVNLTSPEAKQVRQLYEDIKNKYLRRPGGRNRTEYWIKDFAPRANYGGPMMWNAQKIAANEAQFVSWLATQLPQHGNPVQRAKDIFDRITLHEGDSRDRINSRVEQDNLNGQANGRPAMTPVDKAAAAFRMSMQDNAVIAVREGILRDAKKGTIDAAALTSLIAAQDPQSTDLAAADANPDVAAKLAALDKYWREETRVIRFTPGMDPALKRHLGADINPRDAYNATPGDPNGWLLPPAKAHAQYMHYIGRRVEYEKLGVERGATSGAKYVIEQIEAIPEEHRGAIDDAIMANLGKVGENMNKWWRAGNSIAAVWTVFTTLLFTTLSSFTDLAGVAMRGKDFANMAGLIKGLQTTLTTREFQDLARAVGVVTGRTQEHMLVGQGELDYANSTARSMINGFFRYTGLEFYTKFVRSLAVGMGREFIINTTNHANFGVREERYLAELGLTRADVQAWQANHQSFDTVEGEKVRMAIARFAEEAVIRPDASQRPIWASNPYMQVVWQLKSYYYGFGKTVMGGLMREIGNRRAEDGNYKAAAETLLMLAATIIPLTMFGLASREWLKWLFQLAIPGLDETPSMTSKMSGLDYPVEIFQRSGIPGPFMLGITTMEAFQFEGIAAPFTANVPMFDLFDDTMFDGDLTRGVPVLNNIK